MHPRTLTRTAAVIGTLAVGVIAGRAIGVARADSTTCGSYRFETVEITDPTIEFIDGDGDAATEAGRWRDGALTPARVHDPQGVEELDDARIRLEGVAGYGADVLVLLPEEDQ